MDGLDATRTMSMFTEFLVALELETQYQALVIPTPYPGWPGAFYEWAPITRWQMVLGVEEECPLDEYDCGDPKCETHHPDCAKHGECWHDWRDCERRKKIRKAIREAEEQGLYEAVEHKTSLIDIE